ncbi:class I SAM-dependent methyltransferase [Patescibacteria group bacterium]|nr:class I SAM-dependent methyltransferase [Patescibacteria group bacterium]
MSTTESRNTNPSNGGKIVERMDFDRKDPYSQEHINRYRYFLDVCRQRGVSGRVLDLACGLGQGTQILANHFDAATGVDIDPNSIEEARKYNIRDNVCYQVDDATTFEISGETNAFMSAETIEHLTAEQARKFVGRVSRVTTDLAFFTTPNRPVAAGINPPNPFHLHEFDEEELRILLGEFFGRVEINYQGYSGEFATRKNNFSHDVAEKKARSSSFVKAGIRLVYQPIKPFLPDSMRNRISARAMETILGAKFPNLTVDDLVIKQEQSSSADPFIAHTLIAICQDPIKSF